MKKLLFFLMSAVCTIGIHAQFSGSGSGTESDPYLIYNETQLSQMSNFLNQEGVVFSLRKSLDISNWIEENNPSQGWTPIGVESSPFKGTLLGNGYTISGLMIKRNSQSVIGFFGCLNGAVICDLTIKGSSINGSQYTGVFAGKALNSTLSNINVEANILSGSNYCGGLLGYSESTNVNTFSVKVNSISATSTIGGLVGYMLSGDFEGGSITGNVSSATIVGGAVGEISGAVTLKGISTYGSITATGTDGIAGGVIGKISSTGNVILEDSRTIGNMNNKGDYSGGLIGKTEGTVIDAIEGCSYFGDIEGQNYVGGLIGAIIGTVANPPTLYKREITTYSYSGTDKIISAVVTTKNINNCTANGNISGFNYVGGLIGLDRPYIKYESSRKAYYTHNSGGTTTVTYRITNLTTGEVTTDRGNLATAYYYVYTPNLIQYDITNSYYSGDITGSDRVGGVIGEIYGGNIKKNYANANVSGKTRIGGIVGSVIFPTSDTHVQVACIESNVANCPTISAEASNASIGRIYGEVAAGTVVGTTGSQEGNLALTTCKLFKSSALQEIEDGEQHGQSIGISLLKLKSTYVAKGWDFTNSWDIQETECYPYHTAQTAPPVIQTSPVSGGTTISGKATTGSIVYVVIGNNTYQTTTANNTWSVTVPAMQSGATMYAYAKAANKDYSYRTYSMVGYAGSGTEDDPYQIYTATDLANINSASYYKLMNDIDLTSYINANSPTAGWVPVCRNATTLIGFDGDGHTIRGLWTNTTADYTGLFATLTDATVKNLTVKVNTAKQVKGGKYTGILAGKTYNSTFADITVEGTVSSTGNYVGGLVGLIDENTSKSADRLTASVNVTGSMYVGGIAGYTNCKIINSHATGTINGSSAVGGICGQSASSLQKDRFNGDVIASTKWAGGITGYAAYVQYCKSSGSVTCNGTTEESIAGGIAGVGYAGSAYIKNSYSTADVTAYQYAGGIMGYSKMAVSNCYSSGNITASNVVAGVVGYNDGSNATTHNCVALNPTLSVSLHAGYGMRVIGGFKNSAPEPIETDNLASKSTVLSINGIRQTIYDDPLNGKSNEAATFNTAATYTNLGWNFDTVWTIDEGGGYPYLQWEPQKTKIVLSKYNIVLKAGSKDTLIATISPTEAAGISITWTMSNSAVATVNAGIITAVAPGTAIITAAANDDSGATATCSVTVTKNLDIAIANLQAYVDSAHTICDNAVEGIYLNEYAPGAKTALQSVIDEVSATISATMTEESITQGTTRLDAALAEFESKRVTSTNVDYSTVSDIIYINNVSSASAAQLTVPVILNNSSDISDIQFDIVLPAGVTIAKDEDDFEMIEVGDRTTAKKHSIDCLEQPDGSVRVMCTSSKGYTFEGNTGTVLLITLNLGSLEDGDYTLNIKNSVSSNADNTYHLPNTAATISIVNFVLGDINSDGNINVGDLSRLVKMILNDYTTVDNIFRAADINGDNQLNVGDYSKLVQMILNAPVSGSKAFNGSVLSKSYLASFSTLEAEDMVLTSGRTEQIAIRLNNNGGKFNALQFDVTLPEGLHIDENATETAARTSGFNVATNGKRVILSNTSDKAIDGEEGVILYLGLKADYGFVGGTNSIEFNNVLLSTINSEVVKANDFSSTVTEDPTGIDNAQSSILKAQTIYDLQGRKVKATSGKGIYIIDKKKIKTK